MDRPLHESVRLWARLAGACYLVTIVSGVFAEVFVRGRLVVFGDAAATANNILTHESLYRWGLAADLVMLLAYLGVTALFWLLFAPVGRGQALFAAFCSVTGIALLAVNSLNHLAPLLVLRDTSVSSAFSAAQARAVAELALRLHGRAYGVATAFFGTYCIAIGRLAWRSRLLPSWLGAVVAVGGAAYVASSFLGIVATAAARLPDLTIVGGVAELILAGWLVVFGVDAERRPAQNRPASSTIATID